MIYVYKCKTYGHVTETSAPMGKAPSFVQCSDCEHPANRWYGGENKRANLSSIQRDMDPSLILPSAKTFESKADPDGSKGLTKWLSQNEPAPGNKRPHKIDMPAGSKTTYMTASSVKRKKDK